MGFKALKQLFLKNLVDKNDLLGAIAGLIKIRNNFDYYKLLEKCDTEILEVVEKLIEEMELVDKAAIDFKLGKRPRYKILKYNHFIYLDEVCAIKQV